MRTTADDRTHAAARRETIWLDPRVLATASGAVFGGLGRITQMVSQDGTSTYGYDAKSQLTSTTHSYQSNETYTFDHNGSQAMTGYQTGTDNRLTNDGTYTYQYDDKRNRTRRTTAAQGRGDSVRVGLTQRTRVRRRRKRGARLRRSRRQRCSA
jgi:YD repeat-containing protein